MTSAVKLKGLGELRASVAACEKQLLVPVTALREAGLCFGNVQLAFLLPLIQNVVA